MRYCCSGVLARVGINLEAIHTRGIVGWYWKLLQIIEGYGEGPKLRGLLAEFWSIQEVVTHQNGIHGPKLRASRRMTQGGIALPSLFNLVVESVVRHWMSLAVEDESATHEGLGTTVGQFMGIFYADGGMIRSKDPYWLQGYFNVIIILFRRVVLMVNVS